MNEDYSSLRLDLIPHFAATTKPMYLLLVSLLSDSFHTKEAARRDQAAAVAAAAAGGWAAFGAVTSRDAMHATRRLRIYTPFQCYSSSFQALFYFSIVIVSHAFRRFRNRGLISLLAIA